MKEKLVLNYYLQQDRIRSIQEIASDFKISERKAYMLIQDFNYFSRKSGCLLQSRRNQGYQLIVTDEQKMQDFIKVDVGTVYYLNPNHRRLLMQIYLVSQMGYTSSSQLSDYLGASKSTVTADIKALGSKMAAFHLDIRGKTYYGTAVIGSELNKRLCLIKALNLLPVLTLHPELEKYLVPNAFRSEVRQLFAKYKITLTEKVFLTIVQYMGIMANRIKESQFIDYPRELKSQQNGPTLASLKQPLESLIETWYQIELVRGEMTYLIDYIGDQLIGDRGKDKFYEGYTQKGLAKVSQKLGLELPSQATFCQNLSQHLLNLSARITYGSQILFLNRQSYYQRHFFDIFLTEIFLAEIEEEIPLRKITIDEVLYVSLYFKAWLLQQGTAFDCFNKKTVVMAESRSMGYLIKEQLESCYPKMSVNIFDDINISAIRGNIETYDLVITSKEISQQEKQTYPSIIQIKDYLSKQEQELIETTIKELFEWQGVAKLLLAENYHVQQGRDNQEQLTKEWRQTGPVILVEYFFALQFVLVEEKGESQLVIEQLSQPVIVAGKKVFLLLSLIVTREQLKEIRRLCQCLQGIAQNSQLKGELLRCKSFETFKELLKKGYVAI